MKASGQGQPDMKLDLPALPDEVTLSQVYSDFIEYLYRRTKLFFEENVPRGRGIWHYLEEKIALVFCIPNGWGTPQHIFLRKAAEKARIVDSSNSVERISFITEGEASVHFVLAHTRINTWLDEGSIFAVADVGGSTIDSTLYECRETQPLKLEEICISQCVQVRHIH
jgi:hypothetical protein